ncbi:MAG TPA: MFS transporter [Candidatus Limnocylindrales bacterium]|nr:MFS transporter [Candidatus Limnocylindrales bacterium]
MSISRLVPPLLRSPDFFRFWLGQTISVVGDQITAVALPLVAVLLLRADPAGMGLLTAAGLLPHLFFSLPAGVWLDRVHRRRRLMIAADIGRTVVSATVPIAWLLGVLSLEQLFAVAFINGTLAVVFDISWATIFVAVAPRERYVEGSSLLNGSRSLAFVAGPTLAGALVQILGAAMAILADAASFLASALSLAAVHAPEAPIEAEVGSLRERVLVGLRFILGDPIMRPSFLGAATLNLFNFGFQALFILYATSYLHVIPGVLGLVLGMGAVGGVVGAFVAAPIGRRIGLGRAYVLGLFLFPAPLVLVPLAGGAPYELALAALFASEFLAGIGVMVLDVNVGSLIMARTPDRIRASSSGASRFINYGIRPIGALLGGALGGTIGVRETLFVATIGALLGLLWVVGSPLPGLRDLPETAVLS